MTTIYETPNFGIYSAEKPSVYIDRAEGGHIKIKLKRKLRDRTLLPPELAIEYTKLSMMIGQALASAMRRRGVDVELVNYQDMGNWSVFEPEGPNMHMHIFGRATTATIQKYGDAVQLPHVETGFYDSFEPLNDGDIAEIKADFHKLLESEKYSRPWSENLRPE
jgi:diadenosine tetraphosphate (Ap4A) HIT family hydrolase